MYCMSIWHCLLTPMAHLREEKWLYSKTGSNKTGWWSFSWSNYISSTRPNTSNGWFSDKQTNMVMHHVCWSHQQLHICPPHVGLHNKRNITCKVNIQKIMHQSHCSVKHYQADNGWFSDNEFLAACNDLNQTIEFCGVGAHHQNGIVKNRNIQLTQTAIVLLLYGMRMWPQMVDQIFWPFAIYAMNSLHIDTEGNTPESKFYGVNIENIPVKTFHTMFCQCYVQDSRLHTAGSIGLPKWEPRSNICVYLWHSPLHAGSVALFYNPSTGHVSPQYHVVFDNDFTTAPYMEAGTIPPH